MIEADDIVAPVGLEAAIVHVQYFSSYSFFQQINGLEDNEGLNIVNIA